LPSYFWCCSLFNLFHLYIEYKKKKIVFSLLSFIISSTFYSLLELNSTSKLWNYLNKRKIIQFFLGINLLLYFVKEISFLDVWNKHTFDIFWKYSSLPSLFLWWQLHEQKKALIGISIQSIHSRMPTSLLTSLLTSMKKISVLPLMAHSNL
jgi:hypothetical protein